MSAKKLSKIMGVLFIIGVVGGLVITLGVGVYNYYSFSDTRNALQQSGDSVQVTPSTENSNSNDSSDSSNNS